MKTSSAQALIRERKRQGLCVGCGRKPKSGLKRCEPCLQKQRDYDKAYRDKLKGAKRMEPVCKLPGGKMRAEHIFDEDGLCDCGQRATVFAPRPELRMSVPTPTEAARLAHRVPPPSVRPEPPAPRPVPVVAKKPGPKPTARPAPASRPWEPRPELLIAGQPVAAIVAELEGRRDALDRAIAALRELAGSPA